MQTAAATAFILVVDDQAFIVKLIQIILERMGHVVMTAACGEEAFLAAARMETVDALLIDHNLQPEQGCAIAKQLLPLYPAMRVMHMSGLLPEQLRAEGQLAPGAVFLPKPFTALQLQQAVTALLVRPALAARR